MNIDIVGDCEIEIDKKNGFLRTDHAVLLQNVDTKVVQGLPEYPQILYLNACDFFMCCVSLLANGTIPYTSSLVIEKGKGRLYQCSVKV